MYPLDALAQLLHVGGNKKGLNRSCDPLREAENGEVDEPGSIPGSDGVTEEGLSCDQSARIGLRRSVISPLFCHKLVSDLEFVSDSSLCLSFSTGELSL